MQETNDVSGISCLERFDIHFKADINTSGLEPVGRAVLVQPYKADRIGANIPGFTLPDSVRAGLEMVEQRAIVIAVGPSAWFDEPCPRAKPGDHVLITKYAGWEAKDDITGDGRVYRLINDREIFCKISNPKGEK